MPFNWLREKKDQLKAEVSKFRNRTFLDATVAACAMVASADGSIDSSEKQKMMGFIQTSDALSVFNAQEVIDSFNKIIAKFEFDVMIGRAEALTLVNKLRKDNAQARLLVRVCIAVGASDGDFSPAERTVVRQIAQELGLDPSEFEL